MRRRWAVALSEPHRADENGTLGSGLFHREKKKREKEREEEEQEEKAKDEDKDNSLPPRRLSFTYPPTGE